MKGWVTFLRLFPDSNLRFEWSYETISLCPSAKSLCSFWDAWNDPYPTPGKEMFASHHSYKEDLNYGTKTERLPSQQHQWELKQECVPWINASQALRYCKEHSILLTTPLYARVCLWANSSSLTKAKQAILQLSATCTQMWQDIWLKHLWHNPSYVQESKADEQHLAVKHPVLPQLYLQNRYIYI